MQKKSLITIGYASLILMGGITGYIVAGSLASLLSSSLFAISLLVCVWLIEKGKKAGLRLAMLLTTILIFFFSYRFLTTLHFFPSGAMALLSVLTLLRLFQRESSCK